MVTTSDLDDVREWGEPDAAWLIYTDGLHRRCDKLLLSDWPCSIYMRGSPKCPKKPEFGPSLTPGRSGATASAVSRTRKSNTPILN